MLFTRIISFIFFGTVFFHACKTQVPDEASQTSDSLNIVKKAQQRDSVKKANPFLIEPPDTSYTGEYLDKYENGNVKFKGWFRFGKRHGQWMAFYPNGILWSECFYDKGLKHGASNVYYESGSPHYKGWFKNDLRDSTWIYYDEKGKEALQVKFKNDEEVSDTH